MNTLPTLPHGEGSFGYVMVRGRQKIRYRKSVSNKIIVVYGDTVKECQKKMTEKINTLNKKKSDLGTSTNHGEKTILSTGMAAWLKLYKYGKVKARTYDALESTLNCQIIKSSIGNMQIQAITGTDIQELLNDIALKKSDSTVKKVKHLLKQYFDYYYNDDPTKNPMRLVKLPKHQKIFERDRDGYIFDSDHYEVLNDEEINLLTEEFSQPYVQNKRGYRNGYGILFIMWSFVRFGEAVGLQWKDVNFEQKTVNIYKAYSRIRNRDSKGNPLEGYKWVLTTPKSKKGIRNIPVCDKAIECLRKYREVQGECKDSDFIFTSTEGNPLTAQFLNNSLQRALINARINTRVTIHGLRHTGISYFIRHGVSDKVVSELAGHADVSITDKIYYNVIEEQKKSAIKSINDLQKGNQ